MSDKKKNEKEKSDKDNEQPIEDLLARFPGKPCKQTCVRDNIDQNSFEKTTRKREK